MYANEGPVTQTRSVKRGYKNGDIGGVWSRAVWSFVGVVSLFSSAIAALCWAAEAARQQDKRPKTSALGKCSWVYS